MKIIHIPDIKQLTDKYYALVDYTAVGLRELVCYL